VSKDAADRTESSYPGLAFEAVTVEGEPGTLLVEESRHAALLVVGSRGHSGVASVLLGSVSGHCVHHAACPVVVIRGEAH
jgi:nucleotide-binding universal stress UspA family protein